MRYKLIGLAVVLLLASPASAQKVSPVIVETPRTTIPTVVKTGESFKQVYVVKFFDSSGDFEEIKIQEDQLSSTMLGSFEVLNLSIVKEAKRADYLENVWYLEYTLRIINEKKSNDLAGEKKEPYKIPRITIPWTGKKIGERDSNLVANTDIKTQEVYINYVSTITEDPYLFIRDDVDFGSFSRKAFWFGASSWVLWIVPPGLWLLMLVRRLRSRASLVKDQGVDQKLDEGAVVVGYTEQLSRKEALRNLRRSIKRLVNFSNGKGSGKAVDVMSELNSSIISFLKSEVSGSNPGTTPKEMLSLVRNSPASSKKWALVYLADTALMYQTNLETASVPDNWPNNLPEATRIESILSKLDWRSRLSVYMENAYSRFRDMLSGKSGK